MKRALDLGGRIGMSSVTFNRLNRNGLPCAPASSDRVEPRPFASINVS